MATAHVPLGRVEPARAHLEAPHQRRRASRQHAGWLLVEAKAPDTGHCMAGRLLDVSSGGLGLVLGEQVPLGSLVQIAPTEAAGEGRRPAWQGREARVVYTSSLPGGSWRVGLAFTAPEPSGTEMWGTRLVLLAALVLAFVSVPVTQAASLTPSAVVAAVVVALAAGAEWQHRCELKAYRRGLVRQPESKPELPRAA